MATTAVINIYLYKVPKWLSDKESPLNAGNAGDLSSIPGLRRSPGGGNDNPLQYSCLENPIARGAWRAAVHGVAKSQTQQTEQSIAHLYKESHDVCLTEIFSIIMYGEGIHNEETVYFPSKI